MDEFAARIWSLLNKKSLYLLDSKTRALSFLIFSVSLAIYVVYVLVLNNRTYANVMAHDVFLFIDGAYRVSQGSIPHIDFVSALGAINFLGPYWLSGNDLILALPRFVGSVSACLILMAMYVGYTRLNIVLAFLLVTFITILTAAPSNLGQPHDFITFAMFYNRLGYGVLVNLFLLTLPIANPRPLYAKCETVLVACALLFLFHLKITFFAAAVGVLTLGSLISTKPQSIVVGAGLFLLVLLAIYIFKPEFYPAYLHDLLDAGASRTSEGAKLEKTAEECLKASKIELFLSAASTYLIFANRRKIRNANIVVFFYLFTITVSFLLILLNAQKAFLVLPVAISFHATSLLQQTWMHQQERAGSNSFMWSLLISIIVATPFTYEKASSLDRYRRASHEKHQVVEVPNKLSNFVIEETKKPSLLKYFETNGVTVPNDVVRELSVFLGARQEILQPDYLYSITEGSKELKAVMKENGTGPVVTFDFANPFPALLDLPSCKRDYLWLHPYVNISEQHHLAANIVLASAKYIAIPKFPVFKESTELANDIYGGYVKNHFRKVQSSELWEFWERREDSTAVLSSQLSSAAGS